MNKIKSEFVDYLTEVFETFGTISARRMFGGYGIYHQGLMLGLVADDVLYLKVDQETKHRYVERGLEAFAYEKAGRTVHLSYFMAPEEIYEDPEQARLWATMAYEAALRNAAGRVK